jgi:hypothetical protein
VRRLRGTNLADYRIRSCCDYRLRSLRVIAAIIEADRNNPVTKYMKYWQEYDRTHPEGRPCERCGRLMKDHFKKGRRRYCDNPDLKERMRELGYNLSDAEVATVLASKKV